VIISLYILSPNLVNSYGDRRARLYEGGGILRCLTMSDVAAATTTSYRLSAWRGVAWRGRCMLAQLQNVGDRPSHAQSSNCCRCCLHSLNRPVRPSVRPSSLCGERMDEWEWGVGGGGNAPSDIDMFWPCRVAYKRWQHRICQTALSWSVKCDR